MSVGGNIVEYLGTLTSTKMKLQAVLMKDGDDLKG